MHESAARVAETLVLDSLVRRAIRALQLDADGEVVAMDTFPETGLARVPGPAGEGDELDERAVAPDQEMGGYPQIGDGAEALVSAWIDQIAEQVLNVGSPELAGRQADAMDDDQVDVAAGRPGIEVRGRDAAGIVEPVSGRIEGQHPAGRSVLGGSGRQLLQVSRRYRRIMRMPRSSPNRHTPVNVHRHPAVSPAQAIHSDPQLSRLHRRRCIGR